MKKILIVFAHPAMNRSKINSALIKAVKDLDHVTVNDLYENYPDYMIDVKREQAMCENHDIIVFQHPMYWYSTPAIMKEWMDLVLEHGWAYGSKGIALKGKYFMEALTIGGEDSNYQRTGFNHYTIEELTSPLKSTAHLCRMTWLPAFAVFGIHRGLPDKEVHTYSEDYRRILIALRDETLDLDRVSADTYINSDLNAVIRRDD